MTRKIICLFLCLLICVAIAVPTFAAENTEFLYDEADLLTPEEEAALLKKLASVSTKYEAQIIVATIAFGKIARKIPPSLGINTEKDCIFVIRGPNLSKTTIFTPLQHKSTPHFPDPPLGSILLPYIFIY